MIQKERRRLRFPSLDNLPIRSKLTLLALLSSALGMLIAALVLISYTWASTRTNAISALGTLAQITAENTTAALAFGDPNAAMETLASLKANPEVELACLYQTPATTSPRLFARFARAGQACPPQAGEDGLHETQQRLTVVTPVVLAGERIGTLHLVQNLQGLRRALLVQVLIACAIFALSFVFSATVAWLMQRAITAPLLRLASAAKQVSETRDYRQRVKLSGSDEVGQLIQDFNRMLGEIESADRQIKLTHDKLTDEVRQKTAANSELEDALQRLLDAQAQLVQSEKLASLGALVAGVAHEINTPVGVSVSAASTLLVATAQLREQHQNGTMTRSDLERFVRMAYQSSDLILKNLQRAADLIHSFKQVAVDQSSDERRSFGLKAYLDEVITSLSPKLKGTQHRISVSCPADIRVDSYPGAFAQILTNFVTNSLLHAWDAEQAGQIEIEVTRDDSGLILRYRDDGYGVPTYCADKIFDPFFTTRRGSGGSGLGLHIVYNLVTQRLGGTIVLNSEPGRGAEFVIRLPPAALKHAA